jgi:hypothetical protein
MFLGAGASVPAPSGMPTFQMLSAAVLESIGWRLSSDGELWARPPYPEFSWPAMAPEVLFGALSQFGVQFAEAIAQTLRGTAPNAVHDIAARVLARGGLVWTTNIDDGIEHACLAAPSRAGSASHIAPALLKPLGETAPGTLVKFHGTVEDARTLAFTDRELLAPLDPPVVRHLSQLAAGRLMVLYGYAGADADLFDLLDGAFSAAREIIWFEPDPERRSEIERSFPGTTPRFLPSALPTEAADRRTATARAFLDLANQAGLAPDRVLVTAFLHGGAPRPPELPPSHPPGITHARIVERFGRPGDDLDALVCARREDRRNLRIDALPGHLRWTLNRSLYGGGGAARLVEWLTTHRRVLASMRPRSLREYLITRGCALRLLNRDWQSLGEFATWAARQRNNPSDLYYRAQAGRYAMRIRAARADAEGARAGLSAARDPERHAGAVLEEGCLAVYEGRFAEAVRAGFELRRRTGRYAIGRWQAWGAWLEAVALCHLARPEEAREALDMAGERFSAEGRPGPVADVDSGRLLAARVEIALGGDPPVHPDLDTAVRLRGRYADDRRLILADIELARGNRTAAAELLHAVSQAPSCPVADAWSQLGLAEVARLARDPEAADRFATVGELADTRGAYWLAAQAVVGLRLCGDPREQTFATHLPADLSTALAVRTLGNPRVLWMTIL